MNKRVFIVVLVALFVFLIAWIFYVSIQEREGASVESISNDWWNSGHADLTAEAFIHWNEDDPPLIPVNCAKCHSGRSFIDFIGQDGSAEFSVDQPGPINSVVSCDVCHSEKAHSLEEVTFPSGVNLSLGKYNAVCATCHSGLSAGTRVASVIEDKGDDVILPDTSFITPHYFYAAAAQYGSDAHGGYEYPESNYVGKFFHAEQVQTCIQCHDPHSLAIKNDYEEKNADLCAACHPNVKNQSGYKDISVEDVDYDGDGKVEGLYYEIEGVREYLYGAIKLYAKDVIGTPVVWADQNPYLFIDSNENGKADQEEVVRSNAYSTFTPRLLRAGFNYQFSIKDPGAYVHNGKYILQLLYDSIQDLSSVVDVSTVGLIRPGT